jgi:hypothetical protein
VRHTPPLASAAIAAVLTAAALVAAGCGAASGTASDTSSPAADTLATGEAGYRAPTKVGALASEEIEESSGIVASRRNPGFYWTHNDSGNRPYIYLVDRTGASRGRWLVEGAEILDWEDIAAGPGPRRGVPYLYVGDVGDNLRRRREIVVYRVEEPVAQPAAARTARAEAIRLRYPDGAHDAETLLVHPKTGDLYVVTKRIGGGALVFKAKAPLDTSRATKLSRVATLGLGGILGGLVTGGDVSPDGHRVALCDYAGAHEYVLPAKAVDFDAIWRERPREVEMGAREQGEAICYRLDGAALLATSEGRRSPIYESVRKAK